MNVAYLSKNKCYIFTLTISEYRKYFLTYAITDRYRDAGGYNIYGHFRVYSVYEVSQNRTSVFYCGVFWSSVVIKVLQNCLGKSISRKLQTMLAMCWPSWKNLACYNSEVSWKREYRSRTYWLDGYTLKPVIKTFADKVAICNAIAIYYDRDRSLSVYRIATVYYLKSFYTHNLLYRRLNENKANKNI